MIISLTTYIKLPSLKLIGNLMKEKSERESMELKLNEEVIGGETGGN